MWRYDTLNIVVVDSGVNKSHEIFKKDNILSLQYIDGNIIRSDEDNDLFGHGTAISGIISRCNADIKLTVIGISDLADGLDEDTLIFVLNYINENLEADIINLSLGINICEKYNELYSICSILNDKGIVIISAFDNSGAISYPAAFDNVIGVISGRLCSKTSEFVFIEDTVVNIAAKGSIQRVAWSSPDYMMIGGNSFACAHVTASAAVFMQEGAKGRKGVMQRFSEVALKKYSLTGSDYRSNPIFKIKRAALFPFNKEMHSIVRYSNLLSFDIDGIYDVKYSATVGATTSHIMKDSSVKDILVNNISNIDWNGFDTLILGHTDELSSLINRDDLKKNLISEAVERGKKIFSFDDLTELGYVSTGNIYFPRIDESNLPPNRFGMLYRISKPVVGVFGTSSRQGKFTLQLKLRELFISRGYNVGQIGTEPSALLYGMDYVFPMGYNSSVHIREYDTIRYINHIVNDLCMKEKDIIIAGSQSGTVPFDTGSLAQYTAPQCCFLMGLQPDAVILCVNPFDDIDYINRTIKYIEACSDCNVIALSIFPMNIREDFSGIYGSKKRMTDEALSDHRKLLCEKTNVSVFVLGDEKDMNELTELIINYF